MKRSSHNCLWFYMICMAFCTSAHTSSQQLPSEHSFPEIRIFVSERQLDKLQERKGSKMILDDAKMTINGKTAIIKELHLRGKTTLNFIRKSFSVNLGQSLPISIGEQTIPLKKFNLLNLAMDQNLWRNRWSYLTLSQLGIFPPYNSYCTLFINDEPKGIYLLVEKPQSASATLKSPYMIRRGEQNRIDNEYVGTSSKEEIKHYRRQFRSLYNVNSMKANALYAHLRDVLNINEYFTWVGFNYLIKNGDYADELFLYINPDTKIYQIMAWDYDDILTEYPHEGKGARNSTHRDKMLFSLEDELDMTIATDEFVYSKYLISLKEVLQKVDSTVLATTAQTVLDELEILSKDPLNCKATMYLDRDQFNIENASFDIKRCMKYLRNRRTILLDGLRNIQLPKK